MEGKLSLNIYVLKSNKVICFYPVYEVSLFVLLFRKLKIFDLRFLIFLIFDFSQNCSSQDFLQIIEYETTCK